MESYFVVKSSAGVVLCVERSSTSTVHYLVRRKSRMSLRIATCHR